MRSQTRRIQKEYQAALLVWFGLVGRRSWGAAQPLVLFCAVPTYRCQPEPLPFHRAAFIKAEVLEYYRSRPELCILEPNAKPFIESPHLGFKLNVSSICGC